VLVLVLVLVLAAGFCWLLVLLAAAGWLPCLSAVL
jgi:hypothetical protein